MILLVEDVPWADTSLAELRALHSDVRVLNLSAGCRSLIGEAAELAASDRFLTLTTDVTIGPDATDARVPRAALSPSTLPVWPARNAANGSVSATSGVQLWSRELAFRFGGLADERSARMSLEQHVAETLQAGVKVLPLPGMAVVSDPGRTAFHAFRAGFRAGYGLSREHHSDGSATNAINLKKWCNLGRHRRHGVWMIYGARLGYWASLAWPTFPLECVDDDAWFMEVWENDLPLRLGPGTERCDVTTLRFDLTRVAEDCAALGKALDAQGSVAMADISPDESALVVEAGPAPNISGTNDLVSAATALCDHDGNAAAAAAFLDAAMLLGDLEAMVRLGRIETDRARARALLEAATRMEHPEAPFHLSRLIEDEVGVTTEVERLRDLSAERGFFPDDAQC